MNAQKDNYFNEWLAIEQLEAEGKVTSALEKVEKLHQKVTRAKNTSQQLKTLLFRWKFQQIIDEKSQVKILEDVKNEIEKQAFPNQQLLEMYLAHFLESYLNDNFYKIRNRTATQDAELKDYRTWGLNTFLTQISVHYQNALTPHLALATVPTDNITALLNTVPLSRKYQPSVYDIIAHKALNFYTKSRNRVNKPKDEFLINTSDYFSGSTAFVKNKIATTDTESLLFKALKTYQQLEEIHAQQKSETALVYNILERLQFVKSNFIGSNTNQLYLESLKNTHEEFQNNTSRPNISLALAKGYRNLANSKDDNGKYTYPDYNQKAHDLCTNILKNDAKKTIKNEATNLQNQITQKKVTWITQDQYLPNKVHLAKITSANAKSIQVNAYRVPLSFDPTNFNYRDRDSLTKGYLAKQKIHFKQTYTLPVKNDFNSYSTEVIVPKLPLGNYFFEIITDDIQESSEYHNIQVTELSINKTDGNSENKYQVLNRYTGQPIVNARVDIKTEVNRNNKEFTIQDLKTDEWGQFTVPKKSRYQRQFVNVYTPTDSLSISDYNYGRAENYNHLAENNKHRSKTMAFLDRAIYRPGQKVYFKAVAVAEENQQSQILANEALKITVQNANREQVYETTLTSNEFGSVQGEFNLPEEGLNGNFTLIVELLKPKNKRNHYNARINFNVEEYKRPTFEVAFTPSTEIYKPLDSIQVHGNAKAFLGTAITDGEVSFSIKRTTAYRFWWYSRHRNNESKQIATGTLKTDSKGDFSIVFKAETDTEDYKDKIFNYEIEAKVTDLNGETREASTTIKVADKNLLANINTDENWSSENTNEINITTTDINGNPIKTDGILKIYKLESPGRFLNTRPWPVPDIQNIPENEFIQNFPHIPFTNEDDQQNWKKGKSVHSNSFKNNSETKFNIDNTKTFDPGAYILVTEITDPVTKATTESQKTLTLTHKKQDFPPDEKLFLHHVDYSTKNPTKATVKLQTAAPELIVFAEAFDGDISIWKEKINLKKGSKEFTINLPKLNYPKVSIQYKYQLHHKFYTAKDELDFSKQPIHLEIEKKHFLDKISPGTPETWSFVLKSSDNKNFSAEALASMYDASLDQFTKRSWDTNFGFEKNYPGPNVSKLMNRLGTKSTNYTTKFDHLNTLKIRKESLNFYGFEFEQLNSWRYKNYLNELKNKLSKPIKSKGNINITGTVFLKNLNQPAAGVSILKKGTKEGAITDFDGNFELKVKIGDVIEFIYTGYITYSVTIDKANYSFIIELEEDPNVEQPIVVGYGVQKMNRRAMKAESGMSANIQENAEMDMAAPKITIRGAASNNGNNSPLIIVDGKPTGTDENIITQIGADNIKSVEVLKDANAVAIYGEQAKNGVILIFTKNGFTYTPEVPLEDLKNIKARTNLQETAFFLPNLRTNKKGEIEFQFDTPEALTRWNFRMLAHTQKGEVGKLNAQTLTQKELNIIPNAPRFVREGDVLRFSAKIANLTDGVLNGTALLEWTNPTNGKALNEALKQKIATQKFSINAQGNTLVHWKIEVPEDLSAIQYKIVAKAGNFTDGEEKIIPVLSNRMLVTESIPMWVQPGTSETYSLVNFNPESTTQKPHAITLEYTSNPAWLAIKSLPYLMEFPHECSEQTFSRLYANTVASHILNSQPKIKAVFDSWAAKGTLQSPLETNQELKNILISESPWLQEACSETEQQQRLGELFDLAKTAKANEKALNKLRQLQLGNGGFPWFKGGKANPFITRHILAGFGHLEKLNITDQRTKTDHMVKSMIQFLDRELENDLTDYLKHHKTADGFYKKVNLLHYAYARSFFLNRFPVKGQPKEILTKALNYQKENWQLRSIYEKGLLALNLHRFEKSPVAQQILTALTESAVQSKENGMYWKENQNSWWWYKSEISTQSLLIEAFAELEQPKKHVEGLKLYLLKNKRTNRWESTIQTADATYALLLQGNDWLSLKDNTLIEVGGQKIATKKLSETEKEQGTGYLKTRWNAQEITPEFKEIKVTNKSKQVGYGGYYWQYFENLDNIKTDDKNPLSIEKQLYIKVTTNNGTELKLITDQSPLKIGDKVTVRLLVKSDDNMEFVHLKDQRASGFEPTQVLSGYEYKDRLRYYQSTKDVATHFFIDYLPKGKYVLEYDVIANQNGNFSNGITQLQCMYAPEFSSHSAGQRVEIMEELRK